MAKSKKTTAKRKSSKAETIQPDDPGRWEAESQVSQALMASPKAKAEVRRVMQEIKAQRAATRVRLLGKLKK